MKILRARRTTLETYNFSKISTATSPLLKNNSMRVRDQAIKIAQPISALSGGVRHFSRWVEGGGKHF